MKKTNTYIFNSQIVVIDKNIYLIGGIKGNSTSSDSFIYQPDVFRAPMVKDNSSEHYNIKQWEKDTPLPEPLAKLAAIGINNKIYTFGGWNGEIYTSNVYVASINKDGSIEKWDLISQLPIAMANTSVIGVDSKLYTIGGESTNGAIEKIYTTNIKQDGSLDKWEELPPLPKPIYDAQVIPVGNRLYLFAGLEGLSHLQKFYYSKINQNGELGQWLVDETINPEIGIKQVIKGNKNYFLLFNFKTKTRYNLPEFGIFSYRLILNRELIEETDLQDNKRSEIKHMSISDSSVTIITEDEVLCINTNELVKCNTNFKLSTSYTSGVIIDILPWLKLEDS